MVFEKLCTANRYFWHVWVNTPLGERVRQTGCWHRAVAPRSTLAVVLSRGETENKFYEWPVNHHEPHFNTEPGAVDLYRAFQAEFAAACGDPKSDDAIVHACAEMRR